MIVLLFPSASPSAHRAVCNCKWKCSSTRVRVPFDIFPSRRVSMWRGSVGPDTTCGVSAVQDTQGLCQSLAQRHTMACGILGVPRNFPSASSHEAQTRSTYLTLSALRRRGLYASL